MSVAQQIARLNGELEAYPAARLVAVSKRQPNEKLLEAYNAGQRHFGENIVQELVAKQAELPADIKWHQIGHLQTNKVKYIAPLIHLIESVDSLKLLQEINKQGEKNGRIIHCLLQMYIASEDTKFGLSQEEAMAILKGSDLPNMQHIHIDGLMGMASNTEDNDLVLQEFTGLKTFFDTLSQMDLPLNATMHTLSMGMSADYGLALQAGSTSVRVGSAIFGGR